MKLVVKPDMLFGKRGKSGLVALNLDIAQVRQFVKERLGVEVVKTTFFPYFSSESLFAKAIYNLYEFVMYLGRDGWLQSSNYNLHS
jgi:succinyl-CoA synthetase beta subunit